MKASTREWAAKAEEDFAVACLLARPRKKPLWAPVCFHAQQCVEKYLKARLNEASLPFHRTHDLEQLLNQALAVEPLWAAFRTALKRLSDAAVVPRYPGGVFTKGEAQRALKTCKSFRKEARLGLGLPVK
jgi:HEPN domain-containing protein